MEFIGLGIVPGDYLLPGTGADLGRWACVACDQYTSQPEYWQEAAEYVGDAPSCLKLVLPECYLPQTAERVPQIHAEMARCVADGVLETRVRQGFVLVERTTQSGPRVGLVAAVDLEAYDFTGEKSLIRPTEETITARLPARLVIRRGAPMESSHIMLLLDDAKGTVLEPLYARREMLPCLYDFPLMQQGGHLKGWAVTGEAEQKQLHAALTALKDALGANPLLFAVGDGNHSLATAKAYWNEVKATLSPEERANHPARYAMVEIVNIHDRALGFEPIHRVLTGIDPAEVMADWADYCAAHGMRLQDEAAEQVIGVVHAGAEENCGVGGSVGPLACATLQTWLDDYLARHPGAEIDYIHGDDVLRSLARAENCIGFLLPPLDKNAFFGAIGQLGILPRKTFSMGHASEKRFYMECRAIRG